MKASDVFVKCLENEGVKYIFGVPGEEIEDLLYSLAKSSIKFIPTRHEQGAAFMADVWGRVSGKAGVCLATLGPGATNLVTGVADANLDKSPVVAITGQGGLRRLHKENHQYLNVVSIFKPITKWNASITTPESIPEVVRKAFKIAESEKPGATHIELPEDVADLSTDEKPIAAIHVRRPDPDNQALQDTLKLLKKSKKPLILAGNGSVRKLSSETLTKLVTHHHIPVVHTFMGQGAVSDKLPESLFTIGFGFRDIVMDAIDQADLVITVGYDIAEYTPDAWNPKNNKKIVHIDFAPAEVYSHYQPAIEIVADVPASLRELHALIDKAALSFDPAWYAPVRRDIQQDIGGYDLKEGQKFTIPGALNILQELMRGDDLLISDVGSHKMWISRNFSATGPNGVLISNGLASMGIALPGALAASLHSPKRRIVAAMGDGGFLMNSQELETAKRVGAHFTCIIFNDNDYGLISWKQKMNHPKAAGTKISNPDFKAYAESFGIRGHRPTTLSELKKTLKDCLSSGKINVIEIPVVTDVNMELINKLKKRSK